MDRAVDSYYERSCEEHSWGVAGRPMLAKLHLRKFAETRRVQR